MELERFVSIEYPGNVQNIDKALETLGGISKISQVYKDENRRLELRFRPSDLYCKPTCGERYNSTAILIKVIVKKKKKKERDSDSDLKKYVVKPLGIVHTAFKFENLCDAQYLPYAENPDTKEMECIYDELLPQKMTSSSWLDSPAPLYLPPAIFSRMDTPQEYRFRKDSNEGKTKVPQNVICRTRQKRTHFAIFQSFKDAGVPTEPLKGAISQMRYKLMGSDLYQKLRNEFNERPIWSKNALMARLNFSKDRLKYLLPTVAYYFPTGPWRNLWVLFGYDPRVTPNSWFYQTFDFRIRQSGGSKNKVQAKRSSSNYILPYKSVQHAKRKTSIITSFNMETETNDSEDRNTSCAGPSKNTIGSNFYMFKLGMVPPYRQMFYQYCDIHVDEIEALLQTSILTGANTTCSEKNGWLPPGVEMKCRDILSEIIEKTLLERGAESKNEILEKEPLSSSGTEDETTEEEDN